MLEMLSIRTKWLDDKVESMAKESQYLIILGAGYDTRGFRLDLTFGEEALQLWEVHQPQVQQKKLSNLHHVAKHDASVAETLKSPFVHFVPVDFNVDSLDQKLKAVEGFQENQKNIGSHGRSDTVHSQIGNGQHLTEIKGIFGSWVHPIDHLYRRDRLD